MSDASAASGPQRGPLERLGRWMRRRGTDEGVGQALEAMVIGAVVLGAIGFAISSKAPPPPSQNAGSQTLADETWDAVEALDKMEYPDSGYGNSTLSKLIADAAAGNPDPLADSLEKFMPPGSEFQVYLNNGHNRFELYSNRSPSGQTVGVAYPIEPSWKHHYGRTGLSVYNANATSIGMGANLIPIFNSNLVQDEGRTVRATVNGSTPWVGGLANPSQTSGVSDADQWPDDENPFVEDSYTTLIQGGTDEDYPSASIHMTCARSGSDAPCYGMDLTGQMDGYGPTAEDGDNKNLALTVENTGPGAVPAGASLNVSLPVGVEVVTEDLESPQGGFDNDTIDVDGVAPQPQTVHVELASSLETGEEAQFDLWITSTDDRYAYARISATFEGQTTASSSQFLLVVEDKDEGTYTGGDTRAALVSAPRPAGSGDSAHGRWAVVLPTPIGNTTIDRVTLELPHEEGHFESVKFPSDFDPTYPTDTAVTDGSVEVPADNPNLAKWTISQDYSSSAYQFVEVQFNLTTDGTFIPASPAFPTATPEIDFEGYDAPPHHVQREPGLWWSEHPPDEGGAGPLPGYGATAGSPSESDPRVELEAPNILSHRNSELNGDIAYNLVALDDTTPDSEQGQLQGAIKDATQSSHIEPSPSRVAPGESVDIDVSARDMALFMSQYTGLNQQSMETHVYAPWGIRNITPAETFTHKLGSETTQSPKVLMPAHLNNDDTQDLVVASTDANLYGLDGETGDLVTGKSYKLPDAGDPTNPAEPSQLTRASATGGSQIYGVGTTAGFNTWYSVDENLDGRWEAEKPEGGEATLALNASMDLVGDPVPDIVSTTKLANVGGSFGDARITLWDGSDRDGDGMGDIADGWGNQSGRVLVNGTPNDVGMANLSRTADPGVFAATGFKVGSNVLFNASEDPVETAERAIDAGETAFNNGLSWEVKDSGLVGVRANGNPAWNLTGARFGDVERAQGMELGTAGDGSSGGAYDGLVGRMSDGWVMGMNASQPIYPVKGWAWWGSVDFRDNAFANELEGYWVGATWMYATSDAGTTYKIRNASALPVVNNPDTLELHAVDTPDAPIYEGSAEVSWWAGTGTMYRSPDRLETVENLTTTAEIVTSLTLGDTDSLTESLSNDQLDLSTVKFNDVHAVSTDEAWFVGEGTTDTNAYLVHVRSAGDDIDVYKVDCKEGGSSFDCGATAIDASDDRLWVAGTDGLVMTGGMNVGSAGKVDLVGSGGINGNGALPINVTSSDEAKIKNITVEWTPEHVEWMRGVTLNDAEGNPDLWNESDGADYMEDSTENYAAGLGAASNATLYADSYTQAVGDNSDRFVDGDAAITLGPFKNSTEPDIGYYGPSAYDEKRPMNFTANISFDDGTYDHYKVWLKDDGSVEAWDDTPVTWKYPDNDGYTVPDTCFGTASTSCSDYNSVNASDLHPEGTAVAIVGDPDASEGVNQPPLVRLGPGETTFEKQWVNGLNRTLNDIAVNVGDPDRWVAVGDGPLAARSYDAGQTWTVLPTPAIFGEGQHTDLLAVDATHPEVPMTVGGRGSNAEAVQWWMGGYHENGSIITQDLHTGSDDIQRVDFDDSNLDIDVDQGWSFADISIWNATSQEWDLVYDSDAGSWVYTETRSGTEYPHYNFTGSGTDVVKLRYDLSTHPGFVPQSPMVSGELVMDANTDGREPANDVSLTFDVGDTAKIPEGSLKDVDHNAEHDYLRLQPAANPWVHKLGNYEANDWSDESGPTRGAFPRTMDLSPDGETLFVGTGKIYEARDAPNGTSLGEDNSLYALDVDTGERIDGWTTKAFDNPLQEVKVGEDKIWAVTANQSVTDLGEELEFGSLEDPELYLIDRATGSPEDSYQWDTAANNISTLDMAIFDGFRPNAPHEDLAMVLKEDAEVDDGKVEARNASNFEIEWRDNPSITGKFLVTYDVPRNSLYGTHIVVTQVEWTITDAWGNDIIQTARLHDTFTVTPESKEVSLTPTYNVEVVAWMEDWQ